MWTGSGIPWKGRCLHFKSEITAPRASYLIIHSTRPVNLVKWGEELRINKFNRKQTIITVTLIVVAHESCYRSSHKLINKISTEHFCGTIDQHSNDIIVTKTMLLLGMISKSILQYSLHWSKQKPACVPTCKHWPLYNSISYFVSVFMNNWPYRN